MTLRDTLLALLVTTLWGLSFVTTELGLHSFTPAQLVALRFLIAALPALILPRPNLPWPRLILIGLTLFTGQFLLLFLAFRAGLPPGVASVTQQSQVFFTMVVAALLIGERPHMRQWAGMGIAMVGLALIGASLDADLTALGLTLGLSAALSWSVGNVLLKKAGPQSMAALVAWLSLVPPLPALTYSMLFDPSPNLALALMNASWLGLACALYLGLLGTTVAYSIWGQLLSRHAASDVVAFALLIPCIGMMSSRIVFGEVFGLVRGSGLALIVAGFALAVISSRRRSSSAPAIRSSTPDIST